MEAIDWEHAAPEADPHDVLERGDILYFPHQPGGLREEDSEFLRRVQLTGGSLHKNVAYRPAEDRVSGFEGSNPEFTARLKNVLRSYSNWAVGFAADVLPRYRHAWRLDYASFRPEEEAGRDLPWKKRNDLLHVDAFPSRPTHGDLILRVFTNIHPEKARVWMTSDPFAQLAPLYAEGAGIRSIANRAESRWGRFARKLTRILPVPDRTPYDKFMLGFHDHLKANAAYQENCPKYRFEFPPGSTWMVFTDIAPHAVSSGQFALEQTFLIARGSLANPERAPAAILERLAGVPLT